MVHTYNHFQKTSNNKQYHKKKEQTSRLWQLHSNFDHGVLFSNLPVAFYSSVKPYLMPLHKKNNNRNSQSVNPHYFLVSGWQKVLNRYQNNARAVIVSGVLLPPLEVTLCMQMWWQGYNGIELNIRSQTPTGVMENASLLFSLEKKFDMCFDLFYFSLRSHTMLFWLLIYFGICYTQSLSVYTIHMTLECLIYMFFFLLQ